MFAIIKATQNVADGSARSEFGIAQRRVLEMATIDGARALGVADQVGSLTPGKRADIVLIRSDPLNMTPFAEPVRMVVQAAQPQNADTVVVDGRILKRDGRLTAVDVSKDDGRRAGHNRPRARQGPRLKFILLDCDTPLHMGKPLLCAVGIAAGKLSS
jgi:cytosine/adenosine deaminase-related metal-dependent hydrolase